MIHLEDVRLEILRGISLDVENGEAMAVIGPSGSGKSTLMMVMTGLEKPSAGRVTVAGHDLGSLDEGGLALFRRRHVGIVFQSFHLIPSMTAIENVAVPLELAGVDDPYDRARETLAAVGLAPRLAHYPVQLSGGEQQRVAIARAFAPGPELILADEPTGNLDQATGAQVIEMLFTLKEETGATLLLITHDETLAQRCARSIHLADGRITGSQAGPAA
jgi:putative ABC transport system ATP-binding protein